MSRPLNLLLIVSIALLNGAFEEVHGLSAKEAFEQYNLTRDFIHTGPESTAFVTYASGNRVVDLGNHLECVDTKTAPAVQWDADSDALYTLIMLDLDGPTPETRHLESPVLQWLVNNIPGNDVTRGDTCVVYRPPAPVGPPHRYAFVVYKQCGRVANDLVKNASGNAVRDLFNIQKYTTDHNLLGPVAGNFFYEQVLGAPSL